MAEDQTDVAVVRGMGKKRRVLWIVGGFVLLVLAFGTVGSMAGCQPGPEGEPASPSGPQQATTQLSQDDEVYGAVLQHLLYGDWKDYWGDSSEKRFVGVAGSDPSDALLARFSEYEHSLHKFSGCSDTFDGVFDKETGEPAILYRIDAPNQTDEGKTEVHFYLRSVGWGGAGATLTVEKTEGAWRVTGQGPIMKG